MRKYLILSLVLVLVLALAAFTAGCGTSSQTATTAAPASSTTAAPGSSTTAAPSSSSTASSEMVTTTAATAAKSLKVGVIQNLGSILGLESDKSVEAMTAQINQAGGLDIGGDKYTIELAVADSKGTAETARSAVEKLLQQDKVQFIIGDETAAGWLTLTEAAKVPVISINPVPEIVSPKYTYSFQGSTVNTQFAEFYGWFAANYPNVKTVILACPDNEIGHISAGVAQAAGKAFGFQVTDTLFYPPDSQDFTAIAAKVKSSNPDGFVTQAGGPQADGLVLKAVVQSGYKGVVFQSAPMQNWFTSIFIPLDQLNGMVGLSYALEQSPPPPASQQFLDAYKAKYPKDPPEGTGSNMYAILLAALQKAGSVDPDKVATTIASGLTYDSPLGQGEMIARPDQNNTRTVDALVALSIKKIENGKVTIVHVMTLDEAFGYVKTFFGWK